MRPDLKLLSVRLASAGTPGVTCASFPDCAACHPCEIERRLPLVSLPPWGTEASEASLAVAMLACQRSVVMNSARTIRQVLYVCPGLWIRRDNLPATRVLTERCERAKNCGCPGTRQK